VEVIVPTILSELILDENKTKAGNVMAAMLKIKKLDIPTLMQAYES